MAPLVPIVAVMADCLMVEGVEPLAAEIIVIRTTTRVAELRADERMSSVDAAGTHRGLGDGEVRDGVEAQRSASIILDSLESCGHTKGVARIGASNHH